MRFFRSRALPTVIGGRFFITSEQFEDSRGARDARRYTVRVANDDGSVDTVGPVNRLPTAAMARAVVRAGFDPARGCPSSNGAALEAFYAVCKLVGRGEAVRS